MIEENSISQSELARRIGVSQPLIGRLIAGQTRETGKLFEIAKALGTTPQYLVGETDDPVTFAELIERQVYHGIASQDDNVTDGVAIPMLELSYGMGGTFLDDNDAGEEMQMFPAAFIRKVTSTSANLLCWADGIGDSMHPTIGDRDLLLIDRGRTTISVNDQIWVLASGGIGMVKRVRMHDQQVHLMSDNPNVSDYIAGEDDLSVIGRVVAVLRRI
ncbi:MAG: S24 family peptidase [Alteraurantiacibacter sp.]